MPWLSHAKLISPLRGLRSDNEKKFFFILPLPSLCHDQKIFFHFAITFTTPWLREKKDFFSFSYCIHHTIINREKRFFHLVTTFTTPRSREKICFFFIQSPRSLRHDQERKKFFFIQSPRSLRQDQMREKQFFFIQSLRSYTMIKSEKSFFHLVTTFTTPLSRSHYVHYAMIKRKKKLFFISALHSLRHGHNKKILIFIAPLP